MRKTPTAVLLSVAVPALSSVAVLTPPQPRPEPVSPDVRSVALAGVDAPLLRSADGLASQGASTTARAEVLDPTDRGRAPGRPAVLDSAVDVDNFELMGVTWRAGSPSDLTVLVRARGEDGWSEWTALDAAPTPGPADGAPTRAGTEPLYTGPADGYQVRVDVRSGALPADLRVDLVDPGDSPADATVGQGVPAASAAAAAGQPLIHTRREWGADESLRNGGPTYMSTIKAGFVHHTAGTNGYSADAVPGIIRSIYAYHTQANHWSDIGYNFLVDRFGRLWEGRYGGISRNVMGAHTGGFNTNTFAVSAIGNYDTTGAPAEMVDSIARMLAWKLGKHYRNPTGKTTLVSAGGGTSRYPAGQTVTFNVISGHRDAGYTACPGKNLYAQLGTIRAKAKAYIGAGLVSPKASALTTSYGGSPITVHAGALADQGWRLEVRERCTGTLVRTLKGTASPTNPVNAGWDLRDGGGSFTRPGSYDVTLTSWAGTSDAVPWTRVVTITSSGSPGSVTAVPMPGAAAFVPLRPARLYDSRRAGRLPLGPGQRLDVKVTGAGGVPASGVAAVALNVRQSCPTQNTNLTVWPAGRTRPGTPAVNVPAGSVRAALTVSAVGGGGKVSLRNYAGYADTIVDVAGYYPSTTTAGQYFHPTRPFRLYDSRNDPAGALQRGRARTLTMSVPGTSPDQMTAAVLNVSVVGATGPGWLTVYRAGTARPAASTLSFATPAMVSNRVVTGLDAGRFTVASPRADVHVVVDVVGWYAPAGVTGGKVFQAVSPARVLDTLSGFGAPKAPLGPGGTVSVLVRGSGKPVPPGATAVVMTVASTQASATSFLTAWPSDSATRPGTWDVPVAKGVTNRNLLVLPIGSDGRVKVYNRTGSTHVIGHVLGYYR